MEYVWLAGGGVVLAGLLLGVVGLRMQGSSDAARSKQAHEAAQERDPPVEIGETYEFGVTEFSDHHSGARVAVGKVESFVLFTEDVPDDLETNDVIRATVHSFNTDRTSADASFVERV